MEESRQPSLPVVGPPLSETSDEWPEFDADLDLDTPEGAEALRKDEEATLRQFDREILSRQPRIPEVAYQIPQALYEKAAKANDQLTKEERTMLLDRGDVVGKALAHPEELTWKSGTRPCGGRRPTCSTPPSARLPTVVSARPMRSMLPRMQTGGYC